VAGPQKGLTWGITVYNMGNEDMGHIPGTSEGLEILVGVWPERNLHRR